MSLLVVVSHSSWQPLVIHIAVSETFIIGPVARQVLSDWGQTSQLTTCSHAFSGASGPGVDQDPQLSGGRTGGWYLVWWCEVWGEVSPGLGGQDPVLRCAGSRSRKEDGAQPSHGEGFQQTQSSQLSCQVILKLSFKGNFAFISSSLVLTVV